MPARAARSETHLRVARGVLAVLLGAAAGIFVNGYWLVDHPARASRPMLLLTAAVAAVSAAAYWMLLPVVARGLARKNAWRAAATILLGAVLGSIMLLAGTSAWRSGERYVALLLPKHTFRLTAVGAPEGTALVWLSTSLGDTSYEAVILEGWRREGDRLILQSTAGNSLQWSTVTGKSLLLVFESEQSEGSMLLRWEGGEQEIPLRAGRTTYEHTFPIPPYSSREFVIGLGFITFWVIATWLLIWRRDVRTARLEVKGDQEARKRTPSLREDLVWVLPLCVLALLLRILNLEAVYPAVDEYYHLIAADQILRGAPLASVYQRSLWTVTMPVALALRLLGHEVWAARSIGAIFNALAVIPLWLLARRVNRAVAVVACLLFATSPWIITFGRVAREYAYYPFYFYWIVFAMVILIEAIPSRFVVRTQWRELVSPSVLLPAILLILPPVFALKVDLLSTFRTILIPYLVLGLFLMGRLDWRDRRNWPFIMAIGLAVVIGGQAWYQEQVTKLLPVPRLNPVPLQYFFPNPEQQWYFERAGVVVVLALVAAVAWALNVRRSNPIPLFLLAVFLGCLAVFALVSKSFFHTRHLLSTQFWFVLVVAMGLWRLWDELRVATGRNRRWFSTGVALVIALAIFNPAQALLPTVSKNPDMPISEDYMHDMSAVHEYMVAHVESGDALVATVYGFYAEWEGVPTFSDRTRITSLTTEAELRAIIGEHARGWIVIDNIRLDLSPLSVRTITSMPQMEYIGVFDDENVWRWGEPSP